MIVSLKGQHSEAKLCNQIGGNRKPNNNILYNLFLLLLFFKENENSLHVLIKKIIIIMIKKNIKKQRESMNMQTQHQSHCQNQLFMMEHKWVGTN